MTSQISAGEVDPFFRGRLVHYGLEEALVNKITLLPTETEKGNLGLQTTELFVNCAYDKQSFVKDILTPLQIHENIHLRAVMITIWTELSENFNKLGQLKGKVAGEADLTPAMISTMKAAYKTKFEVEVPKHLMPTTDLLKKCLSQKFNKALELIDLRICISDEESVHKKTTQSMNFQNSPECLHPA